MFCIPRPSSLCIYTESTDRFRFGSMRGDLSSAFQQTAFSPCERQSPINVSRFLVYSDMRFVTSLKSWRAVNVEKLAREQMDNVRLTNSDRFPPVKIPKGSVESILLSTFVPLPVGGPKTIDNIPKLLGCFALEVTNTIFVNI